MLWQKTVLVIDDSRTVLRVVSDMLVAMKLQPILASSMEDALKINTQHVDIVMLDLVMPGMDGLEGIRALREKDPDAKIIAMSAGDASEDSYQLLRRARRIGADTVLAKPFKVNQLAALLGTIDEVSGVDCVRVLAIDDSKTICKAIEKMLDGTKYKVTTSLSAAEAFQRPDILGIDVVLTDIFMPGESGIDVINNCKAQWPDVCLIAMSAGHGEAMGSSKALQAASKIGAAATLNKPFTKDQLIATIESVVQPSDCAEA